jgi:hypothetical protein
MKSSVWLKSLLLGAVALLSACGGGGGGSDNTFTPPSNARISASATSTNVPASSTMAITVTVTLPNGSPAADGTVVSSSISPGSLGGLFGVLNGQPSGASANTVGGRAEFVFVAGTTQGTATATFSTQPAGQASAVSTSLQLTVTAPTATGNITIESTRTELPVNLFRVAPFLGSPYLAELTINARSATGQPITIPRGEAGALVVSINPVTLGGLSTLDDPQTEDVNEFTALVGSGPVTLNAGRATAFVHSFVTTGSVVVTASVRDPDTGQSLTATRTISIVSSTPPLPAVVQLFPTFSGLYAQGSGGRTSGTFEADVNDGIGQPVPNPVSGNAAFNNIRVEVIGDAPAAANERVNGINAAGQNVTGQNIALRTTNGIATFTFTTGNRLGQTTVRVTADRADNNVDNGISDPVVAERTVVISDGRLFALQVTSPNVEAIEENRVATNEQGLVGGLDGTYSLTVSALATDRQGNPVLAGTPVEFGLVDAPLVGFPNLGPGAFAISGSDGNPQENGFVFTAPNGAFQTAGGGAGPRDTLLVFGQSVPGNRDLESARTVASVNSQTGLTTVQRFNANDDTGNSVDSGNVLPYLIGRAQHGNIIATGFTDENGVATVRMNYPVSRLGQSVAVWARGSATTGNTSKLITDIAGYVYPGIAPLSIIASPTTIPGNTTTTVTVCLRDAFNSPIQGAFMSFGFSLASGTGTIGGRNGGPLPEPTGSNGCVLATVVTSGMSEDGDNTLTFSLGDAEPAEVEIKVADDLILQAFPSAFIGNGTFEVNLRLIDGAGNPVAGRAIGVECSGSGETAVVSVVSPPTVTDAGGNSRALLSAQQMDQPGGGAEWECEFSLAGGEPAATVIFKGRDSCAGGAGFSPPPPVNACNTGTTQNQTLTVTLSGAAGGTVTGTGGFSCSAPTAAQVSCAQPFAAGTVVGLTVTPSGVAPRPVPQVSGGCQLSPLNQTPGAVFTVNTSALSAATTCSIIFQ